MSIIVEKVEVISDEVFEQVYVPSEGYLIDALCFEETEEEHEHDCLCIQLPLQLGGAVSPLRFNVKELMKALPDQYVVTNEDSGLIQTVISGTVNFAGTLEAPYALYNTDVNGSRAYAYAQGDIQDEIKSKFNAVGVNNIRTYARSTNQIDYITAVGWIEESKRTDAIRVFKSPWGWE